MIILVLVLSAVLLLSKSITLRTEMGRGGGGGKQITTSMSSSTFLRISLVYLIGQNVVKIEQSRYSLTVYHTDWYVKQVA